MQRPVQKIHALVLCKGNICRSPLLEGLLQHRAAISNRSLSYHFDSAGTSAFHRGEPPDPRSIEVAARAGLSIGHQRSRPLSTDDLQRFDFIVAMDRANRRFVTELGAFPEERLLLARHFDPDASEHDVPDPWYGGPGGFDEVFAM
ncbi:MAG: low molecular weight phosphotyrosine protein phosphatase, partial [Betaproteobacteria bacterium]|nr:low molecular weight phosphotyrosine protein phosphatase [Betaproteobacteria bacterium]